MRLLARAFLQQMETMLVSRYLTYICILVRHASLGVRVCKEAGIEMVALIFFFSSQLSPRRGRLLFPHTPSKYDITFLRYGFKTISSSNQDPPFFPSISIDLEFLSPSRIKILVYFRVSIHSFVFVSGETL